MEERKTTGSNHDTAIRYHGMLIDVYRQICKIVELVPTKSRLESAVLTMLKDTHDRLMRATVPATKADWEHLKEEISCFTGDGDPVWLQQCREIVDKAIADKEYRMEERNTDRNILKVIRTIIAYIPDEWTGREAFTARLNALMESIDPTTQLNPKSDWDRLDEELRMALRRENLTQAWVVGILSVHNPGYTLHHLLASRCHSSNISSPPELGGGWPIGEIATLSSTTPGGRTKVSVANKAATLYDHGKISVTTDNCQWAAHNIALVNRIANYFITLDHHKPLELGWQYHRWEYQWSGLPADYAQARQGLFALLTQVCDRLVTEIKTPNRFTLEIDFDPRRPPANPTAISFTIGLKWLDYDFSRAPL